MYFLRHTRAYRYRDILYANLSDITAQTISAGGLVHANRRQLEHRNPHRLHSRNNQESQHRSDRPCRSYIFVRHWRAPPLYLMKS